MEGYLSVVERSNSSEYNNLLEKYNNLLNSYNRLKTGYDKLLRERNSNRTSYNSSVNNNAIAVTSFYLADSRGEDTEFVVKKGQAIYVLQCGSSGLSLCKIRVNGYEGYAMKNSFEYN